jgi:hypothetical protein
MRMVRGLPLVSIGLEGQGPFLFVLDTGAEATVVSPQLARTLALPRLRATFDVLGADGVSVRSLGVVRIAETTVGDMTLGPMDACVLDLEHLERALGRRFDGILGYGALSTCSLVLDYPRSAAWVHRGSILTPARNDVLTLERHRGLPYVLIALGDGDIPLVVDSGSAETLALPRSLMDQFPFRSGPVPGYRATTISGSFQRNRLGRLDGDITLGRHRLHDPLVFLTDGPGRIGSAVLRHFRVTLDPHQGLIAFERAVPSLIVTPGFRTPGLVLTEDGEGWVVSDVLPGTLAALEGVQTGDRITANNGLTPVDLPRDGWYRLQAESDTVHLHVSREGGSLLLTLPVIDLLP